METMSTDGLLDIAQAAETAGITPGALHGLIRRRKVPAQRIGGRCFVRIEDLEEIVVRRRRGALAPAYAVLMALGERGDAATVEELATLLNRPRRTVLGWVQDLDWANLIQRHRGDDPREPARCSLTKTGWELYRKERAVRGDRVAGREPDRSGGGCGSRSSTGDPATPGANPACPDLEDQAKVAELLEIGRIGVTVSEERSDAALPRHLARSREAWLAAPCRPS